MMFLRLPNFLSLLLCAFALTARAEIPVLYGDTGAHDPSTLVKYNNTYYTWITSDGVTPRQSTDLRNWTTGTPVFTNGTWPSWINMYVTNFGGFFWAPECFKITNTFYVYYACSMGGRASAIGVATSTNLSNWTDQGMVIYSDNVVTYGSIDPAVFWDTSSNLWMVFGSHLNGIHLVQLDPATGKRLNSTVYNIANIGDAEAGYIKYNSGYYYLFYNRGICCSGVYSTYNVCMGRSTSVTGPYLDRNGVAVGTSGGSPFMFSTGRMVGPGQVGMLNDNGTNWLTFHYYDGTGNGWPTLGLARFDWGTDGWPMMTNDWSAFYPFDVDATDHRGVFTGTLQNGASITNDVERGRVLLLDGVTNYVQLPGAVANAGTFMAWVKWNGGNGWQRIFDFGVDTTKYLFLTPLAFGGKMRFAIKNGGGEQIMDAPDALPTNTWIHVAVTVDGSRGVLYQNGLPVANNNAMSILPWQLVCSTNYIGKSQYAADPLFSGEIDSFRVFGRALSAVEIKSLAATHTALAHRYSFTTDARDSVGMAHGALMGNATITNGALKLTGASGGYVDLPHGYGGLVSKCTAVTFEFWATLGANASWARVFDFGASSGGFGSQYVFYSPHTSFGSQRFQTSTGAGTFTSDPAPTLDNRSVHVVCILDPTNNYAAIYTNGVLEMATTNTIPPLSGVSSDYSFLGRSLFSADGWLNASMDEFRIYDGRLTPAEITADFLAGPGQVLPSVPTGLVATVTGSQVALNWSTVSNTTSYNVKRATASGGPYITIGSAATNNYTDATLSVGVTNYYVVSAVNDAGESANSSQASAIVFNLAATLTIQVNQPGATVSSNLFGTFFEEINYAGDGGLYGEMVRNRTFEQSANPDFWTLTTTGAAAGTMQIDQATPLNTNNVQSLRLTKTSGTGSVGAANAGYFVGLALQANATYNLSFYVRGASGFAGNLGARLQSASGSQIYSQASLSGVTTGWQKFSVSLVPGVTDSNARLVISITNNSTVWLDVVSLFPQATFNGRTNGMRLDLASKVADLKPSFLRYPGGIFVEGSSVNTALRWKNTIGDIAIRPGHNGPWGYWSTDGFGLHEFLLLCEDLGCEPVYDIFAGLSFGYNGSTNNTVALTNMAPYVQDALDLIQYCNGDTNSTWGSVRAANGHPAPFNLKYIEIGNENGGTYYSDRYALFYDAIISNYPSMNIIASDWGGIPSSRPVEIRDEHIYSDPATFVNLATTYDSYSRSGPKVFVGEYAATSFFGTLGNLSAALGEASFMTGVERNADIVSMACYAPLFANVNGTQWLPDLINYDNHLVVGTPSYYVQQLFSRNRGDVILPNAVSVPGAVTNVPSGAIGVGSWNTSVQYSNIVVTSGSTTLYQSDFAANGTNGWRVYNGTWSAANGLYQQTALITGCWSTTGNTNWNNYTINLKAFKAGGSEGFLILFNWLNDTNYTWLNLGGWGNTQHAIQQAINGSSAVLGSTAGSIATGQWYDIRIVLTNSRIQAYLNSNLVEDVTCPTTMSAGLIASALYNQSTREVIIKAVNPYSQPLDTTFNLAGAESVSSLATMIRLTSGSSADENSLAQPTKVFPTTNVINTAARNFALTLPASSLSVLRLQVIAPLKLAGTVIGSTGSYGGSGNTINNAFDKNLATYYDAVNASGSWAGLDFGTPQVITQIRYCPRPTFASRMVGGVFQGANIADFSSGLATLYTVTNAPTDGVLTLQAITNLGSYRYVRYLGPANGYCNVAEIEFYKSGIAAPAAPTGLAAAPGTSQIALNWNTSSGATSYNVKRFVINGEPHTTITNVTATSFTDTGLVNGTRYYYVVSAANIGGESPDSTQVSAIPSSTTAVNVSVSVSGGALNFSWPPDHTGWRLQVQTNALNAGLGINWVDVPGSNMTNTLAVPVDANQGSVFYRLVY